ncbi:MAG: GNAT family N-acetyltransferase [Bacteroidota bacterium]
MIIHLQTERFILRDLIETDVDGFYELDSDPEVHRYLGNEPVTDKQKLIDVIKYVHQQYIDNGIGRWAIIDKATNEFIGWTGLKLVKEHINNQTNYYDLGYRLIRKYWGKGIATETAKASIDYGFNVLKLKEIIATIHCDNVASNNVAKKLGFDFVETFDFDGDLHNWYKLENI